MGVITVERWKGEPLGFRVANVKMDKGKMTYTIWLFKTTEADLGSRYKGDARCSATCSPSGYQLMACPVMVRRHSNSKYLPWEKARKLNPGWFQFEPPTLEEISLFYSGNAPVQVSHSGSADVEVDFREESPAEEERAKTPAPPSKKRPRAGNLNDEPPRKQGRKMPSDHGRKNDPVKSEVDIEFLESPLIVSGDKFVLADLQRDLRRSGSNIFSKHQGVVAMRLQEVEQKIQTFDDLGCWHELDQRQQELFDERAALEQLRDITLEQKRVGILSMLSLTCD